MNFSSIRHTLGSGKAIAFWGVVYFVSQITIATILKPIGHHAFLSHQLCFSQELVLQNFSQWTAAGLLPVYKAHLYFDVIHPFWYTLFLLAALSGIFNVNQFSNKWNNVLALPILAGLCDVFENMIQIIFLSDPSGEVITQSLVFLGSCFSLCKWSLALGCLLLVLLLLTIYWVRRSLSLRGK